MFLWHAYHKMLAVKMVSVRVFVEGGWQKQILKLPPGARVVTSLRCSYVQSMLRPEVVVIAKSDGTESRCDVMRRCRSRDAVNTTERGTGTG